MEGGERFAAAARAFCLWAEAPAGEASRDIRRALELLSELYAAAIGIPSSSTDGDEPTSRIDETAWSRVQVRFAALPLQWYSARASPATQRVEVRSQKPEVSVRRSEDQETFRLGDPGTQNPF